MVSYTDDVYLRSQLDASKPMIGITLGAQWQDPAAYAGSYARGLDSYLTWWNSGGFNHGDANGQVPAVGLYIGGSLGAGSYDNLLSLYNGYKGQIVFSMAIIPYNSSGLIYNYDQCIAGSADALYAYIFHRIQQTFPKAIVRIGQEADKYWMPWALTSPPAGSTQTNWVALNKSTPAKFKQLYERIVTIARAPAVQDASGNWTGGGFTGLFEVNSQGALGYSYPQFPDPAYVDIYGIDPYAATGQPDKSWQAGASGLAWNWANEIVPDMDALMAKARADGKLFAISEWFPGWRYTDGIAAPGYCCGDDDVYMKNMADWVYANRDKVAYTLGFNASDWSGSTRAHDFEIAKPAVALQKGPFSTDSTKFPKVAAIYLGAAWDQYRFARTTPVVVPTPIPPGIRMVSPPPSTKKRTTRAYFGLPDTTTQTGTGDLVTSTVSATV